MFCFPELLRLHGEITNIPRSFVMQTRAAPAALPPGRRGIPSPAFYGAFSQGSEKAATCI